MPKPTSTTSFPLDWSGGREALQRLALRAVVVSPAQLAVDDAVDVAVASGSVESVRDIRAFLRLLTHPRSDMRA